MKSIIRVAIFAATCVAHFASAAEPLPKLHSTHAMVFDATNQEVLLAKDANTPAPMASITKVLTAMVALDAKPDMHETLAVSPQDVDTVKRSSSRVAVGTELSRRDALHLALMSSENRAASALSRHYPGGHTAFIRAMNEKARKLGMTETRVADSTGLSPQNQASAKDLVRMVLAAENYSPITKFTTSTEHTLPVGNRVLSYKNSNPLVGKPNWDIELSKTGYTKEAGRCIVLKLAAAGKELVVVLLGSQSSSARIADIQAIKRWVAGERGVSLAKAQRVVAKSEVRHAALSVKGSAKSRKAIVARSSTKGSKAVLARVTKSVSPKMTAKVRGVKVGAVSKSFAKSRVKVTSVKVVKKAAATSKRKVVVRTKATKRRG